MTSGTHQHPQQQQQQQQPNQQPNRLLPLLWIAKLQLDLQQQTPLLEMLLLHQILQQQQQQQQQEMKVMKRMGQQLLWRAYT
jgi:hypothetical protein